MRRVREDFDQLPKRHHADAQAFLRIFRGRLGVTELRRVEEALVVVGKPRPHPSVLLRIKARFVQSDHGERDEEETEHDGTVDLQRPTA